MRRRNGNNWGAIPSSSVVGALHYPGRRRALGWLATVGIAPLVAACGGDVSVSVDVGTSTSNWADDIRTLADTIQSVHPDPLGVARGSEWQTRVAQLAADAHQKTDKANLVECIRLTAMMQDEHTQMTVDAGAFAQTAIRFASAVDGIWVQQTTAASAGLLGSQLMAVDGVPVIEWTKRVKALISAATTAAYAYQTPRLLHHSELLWLAGIGTVGTRTTYLLRDTAGSERSVILEAGDSTPLVSIYDGGKPPPLWLSRPEKNYFVTALPGSQVVYVRYARCAEDPAQPIDAFFEDIGRLLPPSTRGKVIFDLRNNPGGNSGILTRALEQNVARMPANLLPKVAVLINNGTFSSATINLYDLRKHLAARVFGEPPGTPPNHTGEVRNFSLPRTGSRYVVSSRVFTLDSPLGTANFAPDQAVAITIDDYIQRRDPVLAKAEEYLLSVT